MSSHKKDPEESIELIQGLLGVGMADEALDHLRISRQRWPQNPSLQEAMAVALHQKMEQQGQLTPEQLDELLSLNLPASHRLQEEMLRSTMEKAETSTQAHLPLENLYERIRHCIRAGRHAESFEIARQIRSTVPDDLRLACITSSIIATMLSGIRKTFWRRRREAMPLINEYLQHVCPFMPKPSPEHSRMMHEIEAHLQIPEPAPHLLRSFACWPDIFWCPRDLQESMLQTSCLTHRFLVMMVNVLKLTVSEKNSDLAASAEYAQLWQRLKSIAEICSDHGDIVFLQHDLEQVSGNLDMDTVAAHLRKYPDSVSAWQAWCAPGRQRLHDTPVSFPGWCMALLNCHWGSAKGKRIHKMLAYVLHKEGRLGEAALEMMLYENQREVYILDQVGSYLEMTMGTRLSWGSRPGEGNFDFYLEQARIACREVGFAPDYADQVARQNFYPT